MRGKPQAMCSIPKSAPGLRRHVGEVRWGRGGAGEAPSHVQYPQIGARTPPTRLGWPAPRFNDFRQKSGPEKPKKPKNQKKIIFCCAGQGFFVFFRIFRLFRDQKKPKNPTTEKETKLSNCNLFSDLPVLATIHQKYIQYCVRFGHC